MFERVSAITLIAAVRRVRIPGCKFDEMLVLESEQGFDKSSALAVLAVKPEWFSDDLPLHAESKELIERTSGKWIVEASELKGMQQRDVEHLKSLLSRQCDTARLAYDARATDHKRHWIVIGTTNSDRYLRDATGNRRFWPVTIKGFDLERLAAIRDQLWAEASRREALGQSIRLAPGLFPLATEEQASRVLEDPWLEILAPLLTDKVGKVRAADVWDAVGMPDKDRTQNHNARIGQIMKQLGYRRSKKRFGAGVEFAYVRGSPDQEAARIFLQDTGLDERGGDALPF